jgi:glutathione S-transferase
MEVTMKLYYHPLSGHSHRARLFLSLIGVAHELVLVDLAKAEQKSAEFIALNSFGQIPVLDDSGTIIADSNAILVYLAKKFGRTDWLPEEPEAAARVQRWLSVAAGQIAFGPAAARLINVFKAPLNAEEVLTRATGILTLVDGELADRRWLVGDRPTIADVALYSYVARAPEGNVDLSGYAHIKAWLQRVEALPGFVEFARTPVGLAA